MRSFFSRAAGGVQVGPAGGEDGFARCDGVAWGGWGREEGRGREGGGGEGTFEDGGG